MQIDLNLGKHLLCFGFQRGLGMKSGVGYEGRWRESGDYLGGLLSWERMRSATCSAT